MTVTVTIAALLTVLILAAAALGVWLFFPWFRIQPETSIQIREEIASEIHTSHNSLTTLAAAAIVLTFSILQAFSSVPINSVYLIVVTWITFLFTVLFGMVIGITTYIEHTFGKVAMRKGKNIDKNKTAEEEIPADELQSLKNAWNKMRNLRNIRLWLLYAQAVSFAAGTIFLTAFAINNVVFRC